MADLPAMLAQPSKEQSLAEKILGLFSPDVGGAMPEGYGANSPVVDPIAKMILGMGHSAVNGVMAPGRALKGELTPEEMLPAARDMAGLMMGGGIPAAEKGALGIFGGRLAATADKTALKRAEEMAASGADKKAIWDQTGWFQGADGKWRFEINDVNATVNPRIAADFEKRAAGDQVPVQNSDRFFDHPEMFAAYPDLWRANVRATKGGGYPYQPHGAYWQRQSGAEGIDLNVDTLGRATSLGLHELQHAIQQREGFAKGADATKMSRDEYQRAAGEVEAYNVQRRRLMNMQERKNVPPWETEDVPLALQILGK